MPIRIGTRRDKLIRLPGIVAEEAFTAADATAITALTKPWTKYAGLSTNTAAPSVDSNRVHGENAATTSVYYRNDWVPAAANYVVSAAFVRRSSGGSGVAAIAGRIDTVGANLYYARWSEGVTAWQLFKVVGGSSTQLGSNVVQALTLDQNYVGALAMVGTVITLLVDGAAVISVTDAAVTAPGRAGMRLQNAATATTGVHLDDWRVQQ